jgi:hypothetical protein
VELQKIYVNISQASVLLPIVAGAFNYKLLTKPFKVLFYFFLLVTVMEIQARLSIDKYTNNMPGQHVYTLIEFLTFSAVFYLDTQKNSLNRRLIGFNSILFIGFAIVCAIHFGINNPNDQARGYSAIFLTVYALAYLYYLFTLDSIRYMWEYPMFWFCTGTLLSFTGTSLYVMAKSYLLEQAAETEKVSHLINAAINIIVSCLFAQTFICLKKQKKLLQ